MIAHFVTTAPGTLTRRATKTNHHSWKQVFGTRSSSTCSSTGLAAEQTKSTKKTAKALTRLLNYVATHPDAILRFTASDMTYHISSDASQLSEPKAKSGIGGILSQHRVPRSGETTTCPAAKQRSHSYHMQHLEKCHGIYSGSRVSSIVPHGAT